MQKPIIRALISVSDKTGLEDLGRFLSEKGVDIISTGGSAQVLVDAGIKISEVSKYIDFPEILNGRVKTLHPKIHGGILNIRDDQAHQDEMNLQDINHIDLVVVNLYPFQRTVDAGAPFSDCIEQIDIGGPTMIRSAAKNHRDVTVIVDPSDYGLLMLNMDENKGGVSEDLRREFAIKAFETTTKYDAEIFSWLKKGSGESNFGESISIFGKRSLNLRYGENPHQRGALYVSDELRPGVINSKQIQGKELSYNNIADADASFELVAEFKEPAVAVIKHANPSGVAIADSISKAYKLARDCDPLSAFGGVVGINRTINKSAAEEIIKIFTEVVIAPDADQDAIEIFSTKKNIRLLLTQQIPESNQMGYSFRSLPGGLLIQDRDFGTIEKSDLQIVTKRVPSSRELSDLLFAWRVCKHVKSNAIVFAKNNSTIAIGAGQMSRVDSVRIARIKAEEFENNSKLNGSVLASDAFFPFADGLLVAIAAGAKAIIQPGGSVRDDEVIAAADEAGISMVFTGIRHFKH